MDPPLVRSHPAGGPNRRLERSTPDRDRLQAEELSLRSVDRDGCQTLRASCRTLDLVVVDRHEVHPHRILLRRGRGLGRVHGRALEEDLACPWGRPRDGCGRRGSTVRIDRYELHPATRALPGLVADDLGMHGALVLLRRGGVRSFVRASSQEGDGLRKRGGEGGDEEDSGETRGFHVRLSYILDAAALNE